MRREAALKSEAMNIRTVNLTAEIFSLTEKIKTTEREMKAEDISFMLVLSDLFVFINVLIVTLII